LTTADFDVTHRRARISSRCRQIPSQAASSRLRKTAGHLARGADRRLHHRAIRSRGRRFNADNTRLCGLPITVSDGMATSSAICRDGDTEITGQCPPYVRGDTHSQLDNRQLHRDDIHFRTAANSVVGCDRLGGLTRPIRSQRPYNNRPIWRVRFLSDDLTSTWRRIR